MKRILEYIFYSNYFYGLCAIALSMEAMLQQRVPLNGWLYFAIVFLATVLYYSYPYIRKSEINSTNPRTNWYTHYYRLMRWHQVLISLILLVSLALFLQKHGNAVWSMPAYHWVLLLIFPGVGAFYYGIDALFGSYNIRKIGWLKPFIIGFTWAGFATIYPVLFYNITHLQSYQLNWTCLLLFGKNLMFVAVLCILFDIKDYSVDYINRLKTFVVQVGLRKTIFYIVVPLTVAGLCSFVYYAATHHFHPMKLLLNTIPFILLFVVALSLRRRRPLLYYLVVIDGLMLAKAFYGSMAMLYF